MANVVVIGSQWGDEGKGKIVDWLSERADVIVRFQGGHNAGHTLVIDALSYKLSLMPSGVVRPGKLSVIGNGVVVDPHALVAEIDRLADQGVVVTPESLRIAENATLILSLHRELDALREDVASNSGTKIGTTRRGIGPAYEDKVGRRSVRAMDLANMETLGAKIDRLLSHHNALRRGFGHPEVEHAALMEELTQVAQRIVPFLEPVWRLLDEKKRAGARILFEGAQGTLLDIDHGTYPFVTSSNTVAGQAAAGMNGQQRGEIYGLWPCIPAVVNGFDTTLYRAIQRDRADDGIGGFHPEGCITCPEPQRSNAQRFTDLENVHAPIRRFVIGVEASLADVL